MYVEEHESFPLNQTIVLTEMVKHFESYQNTISQKVFTDEVDFLHADKHKINFSTLGIKVSYKLILSLLMGTIKHSQSSPSLQYLLLFLKNDVRDDVYFWLADQHQRF